MDKPVTYDHLKSRKKPVVRSIRISLDQEHSESIEELENSIKRLTVRHRARPDDNLVEAQLDEAEKRISELYDLVRDNSVKFQFRSVGRKKYDRLLTEHPPEAQHIEAARKIDMKATLEFNPDTFPEALVAASLLEPPLSRADVADMFSSDDWNTAELALLFQTAMEANVSRNMVPLGNGSRGTNVSS